MSRKRGKPYRPRPVRLPVMGPLRDEIALQLHVCIDGLQRQPTADAWEGLAQIFNLVQLAIEHDSGRRHEARLINGGALALQQIERKAQAGAALHDYEIAPVRVAACVIDQMMGKLDVMQLEQARRKLAVMVKLDIER